MAITGGCSLSTDHSFELVEFGLHILAEDYIRAFVDGLVAVLRRREDRDDPLTSLHFVAFVLQLVRSHEKLW